MKSNIYNNYLKILHSELIPAMGCTEPIAIAFAAAKLSEVLEGMPDEMTAACSGNIIKNVKGVVVPNSGGLRGVEAAAVLGAYAGKADLELEVISQVTEEEQKQVKMLWEKGVCRCELVNGEGNLFIRMSGSRGNDRASVVVQEEHNHISRIEKNGVVLFEQAQIQKEENGDK